MRTARLTRLLDLFLCTLFTAFLVIFALLGAGCGSLSGSVAGSAT